MSEFIYQQYSQNDRIKMLKNQSVKSEVKTYNRSLSDEEVSREKDRYASDAIEVNRQKAELKATQERLKSGINSLETLMEERLERIKTGQTETTGTLYGLPDHNKGTMNWYDNYGECVNRTPLTPDERQGILFLGDDPLGKARQKEDDGGITDVEFEDAKEEPTYVEFDEHPIQDGPKDAELEEASNRADDMALSDAVSKMYEEEHGIIDAETIPETVDIPLSDPTEEKPAKRSGRRKKAE